jgi:hypothetical protein
LGGFDENLTSGIDHDIRIKLAVAAYSNERFKRPPLVVTRDDRATMISNTKHRASAIAEDVKIEVFLVDDGSTDGTSAAIADYCPTVNTPQGNSSSVSTPISKSRIIQGI